jgi:hypothetical protein
MTDFAPRRQRTARMATARSLPFYSLLALSVLAACAGDLDPRYNNKITTGTGTGGLNMSTGSGGAPASTGTGGATTGGGTGVSMTAVACTYAQTALPTKCGFSGCHGMTGTPPDLSSDAMAAKIIGEGAATPCAGTSTTALIDSAAPVTGVLLTRITTKTCSNGQMPLNAPPLSQAEIDCIKSYFMSKLH